MKNKSLKLTLLLAALLAFSPKQTTLKTSAATNINVTNASTQTVRNYYSSLNGKPEAQRKGDALLTNLKTILKSGHTSISYANVWNWAKITDRNWTLSPLNPSQLAAYDFNDDPYQKLLYRNDNDNIATATRSKQTAGNKINEAQHFNREHVWPKSLGNFGESAPAGTDLHHLIMSDISNNSAHGNYPYGNVGAGATEVKYISVSHPNVSGYTGKTGKILYNGTRYTVYEPQDQDKGDIARAMFYMAARYANYTSKSDPFLQLTNNISLLDGKTKTSTSSSPGYGGILDTLIEWHTLDPVDDYEIHRNNLIYNNVQHNRNPFIDYPSWVYAVWGNGVATPASDSVSQYGMSGEIAPTSLAINPASLNITVGSSQAFTVTAMPTNASNSVTWTSSVPNKASITNEGVLTALSAGTTTIMARSTLNESIMATATVTVSAAQVKKLTSIAVIGAPATLKFKQDFDESSISVRAYYDDGTNEIVTNSAYLETPDTSVIGSQTLNVSYTHNNIFKSTTYTVRVTNDGVTLGNGTTIYAPDLIISEYSEGTNFNKYIELYNGTGQTVNLANYELRLYPNAQETASPIVTLSDTLAHGKTIVYSHKDAALTLPTGVSAAPNTAINFNGDDPVALYNTSTGDFADIFGTIGVRPTGGWKVGNVVWTVDKTLVRKSSVTQGQTNPSVTTFDPSEEWIMYPLHTATNLGSHTMDFQTTPGITANEQAEAWAATFLDITEAYCEDLNGSALFGALWDELGEEYTYMNNAAKLLFKNAINDPNALGIGGAKARYEFLITKYQTLHNNNFMTDDNGTLLYAPSNKEDKLLKDTNPPLVLLFSLVSGFILVYYFVIKKNKYN